MFKKLFLGLVAASVIGLATPNVADAGHRHGGYGYHGGGYGHRGGGFYGGRVVRPNYGPSFYGRPYYGGGYRGGMGFGGGGFRGGGLWLGF